jgi:hypothetical protein
MSWTIDIGDRFENKYGNKWVVCGFSTDLDTFEPRIEYYDDETAKKYSRWFSDFKSLVENGKLHLYEPDFPVGKPMGDDLVNKAVEDYKAQNK